jgi:hypothetical protein
MMSLCACNRDKPLQGAPESVPAAQTSNGIEETGVVYATIEAGQTSPPAPSSDEPRGLPDRRSEEPKTDGAETAPK